MASFRKTLAILIGWPLVVLGLLLFLPMAFFLAIIETLCWGASNVLTKKGEYYEWGSTIFRSGRNWPDWS